MSGRSEAEQTDALTWFDTGNMQAAEADDARAKKRGGVQVVECCGQGKDEISTRERVFRIAAVNAVTGEGRRIAEILQASFAIGTGAVGPAKPGNTDARAEWNFLRGAADHFANDLMTGNHARLYRRQVAFHNVKIGAAKTTGAHSEKNIPGFGLKILDVSDSQWTL